MTTERLLESGLDALRGRDVDRATRELRVALNRLRGPGDDTEGHGRVHYSDERLKQAVARVENALAVLEELTATDRDVEGHGRSAYSDERLKRAIVEVEDALALLRQLEVAPNE